jgi:hypothetical protein
LLDEAMAHLGKRDRDAVLLRYFKGDNLRDVAAAMNTTEAAAQSRVHRAVEKLRKFFTRRGVALPAAVLTLAISAHSIQAAPAALANTVTAVAMTKGAAVGGATLTLIKGALKIMAWTKAKTAVAISLGLLLTAGTTTVVLKETVFNDHEPVYRGKTLSAWLADYDLRRPQFSEPAHEAIRQMGTNTLPFLFRWLHVDDDRKRNAAASAYGVLRGQAAVQIPELTKMLTTETRLKPIIRATSATVLGMMAADAEPAIPALITATQDPEDFVRNNSYWALGRIHREPEVVIPVLIEGLKDSFHVARENAATGLVAYGTNATIALPALEAAIAENTAAASAVEHIKAAAETQ